MLLYNSSKQTVISTVIILTVSSSPANSIVATRHFSLVHRFLLLLSFPNHHLEKKPIRTAVHRGAAAGNAARPEMADSTAIFTLQGNPFQGEIPTFENSPLPHSQLTLNEEDGFDFRENLDDLLDTENLLSDPITWEVCNNGGTDDLAANSDSGYLQHRDLNPVSMALSAFLVPRTQYNCACCQILREISHTNGMNMKRLEIHGVFGIITHAVLGIYEQCSSFQTQDCQMFDFHKESTQTVKNFLVQYYEVCRQEGYIPMQDPLSTFYEALSVGLDHTVHFLQSAPEFTGDERSNEDQAAGSMKIPLSMQRERTRQLGVKDFMEYFHLPLEEAAKRLNVCPTVMKKICRKHGVSRWPYRKIKSIEGKISKSEKILEASVEEERSRAIQDIQKYKQQLNHIYADFIEN